ncbi:MAG: NAD(P)-dependent oxidoreductase [Alphaproteobacteria bacterium]
MSAFLPAFTHIHPAMPTKRDASERRQDFGEIYREFAAQKAGEQASRCSQCGVPFCQNHCPLHNNIPDWLRLTAEGRLREAYQLSTATNPLPEICGRVCPQDRLCEGSCVIEQSGHGSVTIGAVEKYLTETAFEQGWVSPRLPRIEKSAHIGIVGAGPAGMAAAEALRFYGYQVTIYDRYDRPGGLLTYGIPNFKLEKNIVLRRADLLAAQGVKFCLNTEIGRDISLQQLQQRHDALLLAGGVYAARSLHINGAEPQGLLKALDYLTESTKAVLEKRDALPTLNAKGRDVVVIGGGDTAMDCLRTAIRQQANSVTCLYRRDAANMPGSRREVKSAEEEGVVFRFLAAPESFTSDASGIKTVRYQTMTLEGRDATGRLIAIPAASAPIELPAQMVIAALGYDADDYQTMYEQPNLRLSRWGTVSVQGLSTATNIAGIFAAGDMVRGGSLVVWAVKDGLQAAEDIKAFVEHQQAKAS